MSVEAPQKLSGEPPPESDNRRISIDSASTEASGETAASDNSLKEELSDPEILVKRNKASLKNKLALGAEAAINKAAKIVANNQGRSRLQCLSVFIFCTALSLAFALHIYFLNDPMGAPPTKEANWAASSLLLLLLINACFSTSGFVIIYLKFSHLVVGFVYLTMLTSMEYYTTIVVSKAVVTIQKGTFDDIKAYSKEHYKQYHLIPDYVAHYEIQGNCCGWGEPNRKFEAWPTLLETNDLPDTCCINQFYGCGRDAVPRTVPSGHMMFLSSAEYSSLFSSSRDQVDTDFLDNDHSTLSKVIRAFPARDGIPDELLRLLDELTDAPMFYYLGEEFAAEGTTIVHVYKSLGQIENYRLKGIIKQDTCNTDQILNDTKFHTMFVLIYGCIQLMLCILMSFVFWYYFLENRAEIFAAEPLPGDFTTLQMERFCLDDQFEAIIQERNRIEKLRELRKQEKEEERKRKQLLADAAAKMLETSEATDKHEEKGTSDAGQS